MIPLVLVPSILQGAGVIKHVGMSDILFLSVKEHAGKLRKNEGQVTAVADIATLTANTGKDMYLGRAKISGHASGVGEKIVELSVNGTVVETFIVNSTGTFQYQFQGTGYKVAAGQIIKIAWASGASAGKIEGFIECFEEDTGVSPFVASEFQ